MSPTPSRTHVSLPKFVGAVAAILGFVALASMFTPDTIRAADSGDWTGAARPRDLDRGTVVLRGGPRPAPDASTWSMEERIADALDQVGVGDVESEPSGLGLMVGGQYVVQLHAGNPTRYSVYRTDGMPLAGRLTAAELKERFPQLDLEHVHADSVQLLMLADPIDGDGGRWGR